jgi:hypothetical protein
MLPKPFRLEQLEDAVAAALGGRISERPTPPATPTVSAPARPPGPRAPSSARPIEGESRRTVLAGVLDEFGLSSLLIVLELERKSGVVILRAPENGVGRIYLREGRVIRASIEVSGESRRGQLAVYDLLTWPRGRFEFNVGEVAGEDEIGSPTSFLLLEGARWQDERNHGKAGNN